MVDFRTEVSRQLFCAITFFGLVRCQLQSCENHRNAVYLTEGNCEYLCPIQTAIHGYLLCKADGHTVLQCSEDGIPEKNRGEECTELRCEVISRSPCERLASSIYRSVRYIRFSLYNSTVRPIYIQPVPKPNNRPTHSHGDLPRITFEEPTSQMYMYGILSFFFGVIAFFVFAVVFRFLYKRYQRHPIHVHTFSGHQLPLGSLQLRSFLSPSPYPPQMSLPHNEQAGIPGLDLPPSYVVASELLDPPPSYEDISKPKRQSAQMKVTSL